MAHHAPSPIILIADDDAEDRLLAQEACAEAQLANELHWVENGEELLAYLYRRGHYDRLCTTPLPGLILLDLNMPKKDGRAALKEIKADPILRRIPIVVLTRSKAEEDIMRTYDLGVTSFIVKPAVFDTLVEVMRTLGHYWFEVVVLPSTKVKA